MPAEAGTSASMHGQAEPYFTAAGAGAGAAARASASVPNSAAPPLKMRERRVPESPLGRALGFAGLGAGLLVGSLTDSLGRVWSGASKGKVSHKTAYLLAASLTAWAVHGQEPARGG